MTAKIYECVDAAAEGIQGRGGRKLRLSEIENDLLKIIRKYEGTNLWLSINE